MPFNFAEELRRLTEADYVPEYPDAEEYKKGILVRWQEGIEDDALEALLQTYALHSYLTPKDLRAPLEALTQQVRGKWADVLQFHTTGLEGRTKSTKNIDQWLFDLIDDVPRADGSGNPQNNDIRSALAELSRVKEVAIEARSYDKDGRGYQNYVSMQEGVDSKLSNIVNRIARDAMTNLAGANAWDDQTLAEHFAQVRRAQRLFGIADRLLEGQGDFRLGLQATRSLREAKEALSETCDVLSARLEYMASPLYARMTEKTKNRLDTNRLEQDIKGNRLPKGYGDLSSLLSDIKNLRKIQKSRFAEKQQAYDIVTQGDYKRGIYEVCSLADGTVLKKKADDGKEIPFDKCPLEDPIVVISPEDGTETVYLYQPDETDASKTRRGKLHAKKPEEFCHRDCMLDLHALQEHLDKADPGYLFMTGSSEFKEMKNMLEQLEKQQEQVRELPDGDPKKDRLLRKQMLKLKEVSDNYLERKCKIHKDTPLEGRRIAAAQQVSDYVKARIAQLDFLRERRFVHEYNAMDFQEKAANLPKEACLDQAKIYLDREQKFQPVSISRKLFGDVFRHMTELSDSLTQDEFTPQKKEAAKELVAEMVAASLITENRNAKAQAAGLTAVAEPFVEEYGIKEFTSKLKKMDPIRNMELTPKTLSDFIFQGKAAAFGREMSAAYSNYQANKKAAQGANAPEKKEPNARVQSLNNYLK